MEHANITKVYSVIRKYCRVSFCGTYSTAHEQVYNCTHATRSCFMCDRDHECVYCITLNV